jgi:hypothetical protein
MKPEGQGATMGKDSRGTQLSNVIRIDDERMRADSDEVGRAFRLMSAPVPIEASRGIPIDAGRRGERPRW